MKLHKKIQDIPDYLNNYEKRRKKILFIKSALQFLFVCLFIYLVYDKTDNIINHQNKIDTVYVKEVIYDTIYINKKRK